jgi:hypothetical protein
MDCVSFARVASPVPWESSRFPDGRAGDTNVVVQPYYPTNFGHAFGDGILPVFQALHTLGLEPVSRATTRVVLQEPCGEARACSNLARMAPGITEHAFDELDAWTPPPVPSVFRASALSSLLRNFGQALAQPLPPKPVCFRSVVMGVGALSLGSMHALQPAMWSRFIPYFARAFSIDTELPPAAGQRVTLLVKEGRRQLVNNLDDLARGLEARFGVPTRVVDMAKLSLREQIKTMADTTVVFSVCGGGSMVTAFLPRGGVRILTNGPDFEMEGWLWAKDARTTTWHFPFVKDDVRGGDSWSPNMYVDPGVLAGLVRDALGHVERTYGWAAGSTFRDEG